MSLLAALALLLAPRPAAATPEAGLRIGRVSIKTENVFTQQQVDESGFLYAWADAIHQTTRPSVVRRELLFQEGDPYDPALLAETERNLRRYIFLRHARVEASAPHDGVVDVSVRTGDAWTLAPRADFKKVAGQSTLRLGVVEDDVLGFGKALSVLYLKDSFHGNNTTLSYEDPQFLGRRLDFTGQAMQSANETMYSLGLSRPYYATIAGYSAGFSGLYDDKNQPLYANEAQVGMFRKIHKEADLSFSKGLDSSPELVRTLSFGLSPQSDRFVGTQGATQGLLPADSKRLLLSVGASWQRIEFIKQRHIQKYDRDEDFNLGAGASAGLGMAPKALGSSENQLSPSFVVSGGKAFGASSFMLSSLAFSSSLSRKVSNQLAAVSATYYSRELPRATFAAQATYTQGTNLDPDRLLLLGGDTGLHAYPIAAFSGNRMFLFNAEQRFFLAEDVFHIISFGAAAFFDAGYAWPAGATESLRDLRDAVGIGLRLAFSRSSANTPIRFDLARALRDNGRSTRLVFSVQTGQAFGP